MMTTQSPTLNRLLQSPIRMAALATFVSLIFATIVNFLFLSPKNLETTLLVTLVIAAPMSYLTIKIVINVRTIIETQKVKLALEHQRADILAKFMRDAAHEFKTPLTIMATNLYMAQRTTEGEKQQVYNQQINEQIQMLNSLLDTILILTRLDSTDKATYPKSVVRASELVASVKSLYIGDGQLNVILELGETLPTIHVNLSDLHLAIKQMVNNALRFSPPRSPVTVRFFTSGSWLVVEIADKGQGISAGTMQHLFQRFYRIDESHTTRGLGLGLAIAKQVVELHDGHIEVASELGKGSTFSVYLPISHPFT